jgi:phage shock protein A
MGIFDRMGRAISANFNSLIDKLEDPKKSVDQTVLEMREQVRAARQEVVRAVAAEKQLRTKVEGFDKEVEKWEKRAELAVERNDDELAREALLQKRRLVGERDRAEALRAEQRGAALEMKQELERMEQKVKEVEARKGTIAAQIQQSRAGGGAEGLAGRPGGGAFEEFRRMEDQIEGVEAAVQVQRELDEVLNPRGPTGLSRSEVEAKFRALEAGQPAADASAPATSEVDQELAQLKKRVRIKS